MVIVVLVYLASQTLLGHESMRERIAYSDLKERVRTQPDSIEIVVFVPKSQKIEARLQTGEKYETYYPSGESQVAFETLLEREGVRFDSKGTGDAPWWSILGYVLPFVIFFGFWIFLMNQMQRRREPERPGEGERDPLLGRFAR